MDLFKRVESSLWYKLVKAVDVIVAASMLYLLWSYTRRILGGLEPLQPISIPLYLGPLWVEFFFLKRIKGWLFDQYLSVPGLRGVFSKAEVKELLSGEEFSCPECFRGTRIERARLLYESDQWLCISDHFFHKKMIGAMSLVYHHPPGTAGQYHLYLALYTGQTADVSCVGWLSHDEEKDFTRCIRDAIGGFLLNDYIYTGFGYLGGKEMREMQRTLKEEMESQPDPKSWLLSGAAIEFNKKKLAKEIQAKEEYERIDARLEKRREKKRRKQERRYRR